MYTVAGSCPEKHGKYGFAWGLEETALQLKLLKAIFCGEASWLVRISWASCLNSSGKPVMGKEAKSWLWLWTAEVPHGFATCLPCHFVAGAKTGELGSCSI